MSTADTASTIPQPPAGGDKSPPVAERGTGSPPQASFDGSQGDERPSLDDLCAFLGEFVSTFICSGGQTVRVERSAQRIGLAFGLNVEMVLLSRHAVITVAYLSDSALCKTTVVPFRHIGLNFTATFGLNRLSWEFFDDWLEASAALPPGKGKSQKDMARFMGFSVPRQVLQKDSTLGTRRDLARLRSRFSDIIRRPRLNDRILCLMTGLALASFCRLFGGDWLAMAIVFFTSQAGFLVRRLMVVRHQMDIRLGFLGASFAASFLSAAASWRIPSETPEIAVASSILFLVPGIPLLSAVNDILHGHTLMGISRGVNAAILTLCIAFGLAATLMVTGFNVL